jgi:hypothetical protein
MYWNSWDEGSYILSLSINTPNGLRSENAVMPVILLIWPTEQKLAAKPWCQTYIYTNPDKRE